jgi:hypothetical protein
MSTAVAHRLREENPALLAYPPTLPIEVALKTAPLKDICAAYNISRADWDVLRAHPVFIEDLKKAVELLKKEGMSFKMRARLQSEGLLETAWNMIHAKPVEDVPANVKADLLKFVVRCAGLEGEKGGGSGGNQTNLQINISLG